MDSWLKNRLSPVKADTPRWQEFAEAIEQFWEETFDPEFAWLVSLRSIYEADLEGQLLIQSERGEYFEDGIPTENIPLAVQQKELELCQKGSIFPFRNTLLRLGIPADWVCLYASRVNEYGTDFVHEDSVPEGWQLDGSWRVVDDPEGRLRAGYFLTSRGILKVELGDASIEDEIALIRDRVTQTRPVWIVFDGIMYHVGTEIVQDHDLEASGSLHAESRLPGWADCGLKLDGTWGLGRVIRLDGDWCLNRGWKIGQIWPRGIIGSELDGSRALDGTWGLGMSFLPHFKISECRIETNGHIQAISEMPAAGPVGSYFQVTDSMPVGLDGDYQLGRAYDMPWPYLETVERSIAGDVYFGGTMALLDSLTNFLIGGTVANLPDDVVYHPSLLTVYFGGTSNPSLTECLLGGDATSEFRTVVWPHKPLVPFVHDGTEPADISIFTVFGGDANNYPSTILISVY